MNCPDCGEELPPKPVEGLVRCDSCEKEFKRVWRGAEDGCYVVERIPMEIAYGDTGRGFSLCTFKDHYGLECSVQDSSLADDACIWLGIDNPRVQVFVPNGPAVDGKDSWRPLEKPANADCLLVDSRMHLTREMAMGLLPVLQRFIETGSVRPKEA